MPTTNKIFLSYSRADKSRVTGLGLLLESLGHKVFLDHKTILPGRKWVGALQAGLDDSDILVVYWTKNSAKSEWVRNEIEYFITSHPSQPIVPILGDEAPLSELLRPFQASNLFPLVNELLDLKKTLVDRGAKPPEIREAILSRLRQSGIEFNSDEQEKLYRFIGPAVYAEVAITVLSFLFRMGNSSIEMIAQITAGQILALGATALIGAIICHSLHEAREQAWIEPAIYGDEKVLFPMGNLSFADIIVSHDFGRREPVTEAADPTAALGVPDEKTFTLGCGGTLIAEFEDNSLIDIDGPDIYIFETGPAVEPTNIEISTDRTTWINIGKIPGGKSSVDIGPYVVKGKRFNYVRLRDLESDCGEKWPGADIDAIGAIGSISN